MVVVLQTLLKIIAIVVMASAALVGPVTIGIICSAHIEEYDYDY